MNQARIRDWKCKKNFGASRTKNDVLKNGMDTNAAYMYCFQSIDMATSLQQARKMVTDLSQDNVTKSHQIVNLTKDLESARASNRELSYKLSEIQAMLDQQIKQNSYERKKFEEQMCELTKQLDDPKKEMVEIEKSKNLLKDQLVVQNQLLANLTEENKLLKKNKSNSVAYNTIQRSVTPNRRPFLLQRPLGIDPAKINRLSISISCEQASLIAKEMKHQLSVLRNDIQDMKKLFCKSMQDIRVIVDVNKDKIITQRSVIEEQLSCNKNSINGKISPIKQQLVDELCQNVTTIYRAFCSKNLRNSSARTLNLEINRRVRDKSFECLLRSDENQVGNGLRSTTAPDNVIESILVRRYFEKNIDQFSDKFPDVVNKIKEEKAARGVQSVSKDAEFAAFPFGAFASTSFDDNSEVSRELPSSSVEKSARFVTDRGFFVNSEAHKDEYVIGSSLDLPQDKHFALNKHDLLLNSDDSSNSKKKKKLLKRFGGSDAVEEIEFQLPHQSTKTEIHADTGDTEDWAVKYGTADPDVAAAPAGVDCCGCGARLHCRHTGLPGFLPFEYFKDLAASNFTQNKDSDALLCRRCYLLKHYNFLLNVNVTPPEYERMLGALRNRHEILVVLIVDMLDFPCSIYRNLPHLVGVGKHLIVVGNKIDLVPCDSSPKYLKHYVKCLRQAVVDLKFHEHFNIMSVQLISAKTGFGVESLINKIYHNWQNKGDIYLVGCTNSGKSTLFNALLQSDLCKVRAVDLVERATASIWPGTTLNLLKFPIMNPTPAKIMKREARLRLVNRIIEKEEQHRKLLYEQTGDQQYAVLQGYIGQTFANPEGIPSSFLTKLAKNKNNVFRSNHFMPNPYEQKSKADKNVTLANTPEFTMGNWCYDTPGTVNNDQIINLLTLEELIKTLPGSLIDPKEVTLTKGQTLLIGGLIRVDFLETSTKACRQLKFALYASDKLPFYVLDGWEVSKFYAKYFGTKVLEVPCGDSDRLAKFPSLSPVLVEIHGGQTTSSNIAANDDEFQVDVVLSSVGWLSLRTLQKTAALRLRVWTPGGSGVYVRRPALLPGGVDRNSERKTASRKIEYKPMKEKEKLKRDI
uniref:G domain-containing protein n=1 Tax=Romanomermis culicivorax TaxID=13658 RepID=A0A915K0F6_ROMCU